MFYKLFALFAVFAVAFAAPKPAPAPAPAPQLAYAASTLDYVYPGLGVPSAAVVSPYAAAPLAYSAYNTYPSAYYLR